MPYHDEVAGVLAASWPATDPPSPTSANHEEHTMAFGPIQIFAFGFPSTDRFEGRIAEELVKLSDAGIIRIIDALAVVADGDEVEILRVSDLDDEQREALGAHIGSLIGLGAAGLEGFIAGAEAGAEIADEGGFGLVEDITEDLIDELPDGSAGVLLIIEHAWAVPFRDAVVDAGGILMANEWIGAQDLVSLGVAMRDAELAGDDD
jgi:uncharacterized membrane protein